MGPCSRNFGLHLRALRDLRVIRMRFACRDGNIETYVESVKEILCAIGYLAVLNSDSRIRAASPQLASERRNEHAFTRSILIRY